MAFDRDLVLDCQETCFETTGDRIEDTKLLTGILQNSTDFTPEDVELIAEAMTDMLAVEKKQPYIKKFGTQILVNIEALRDLTAIEIINAADEMLEPVAEEA